MGARPDLLVVGLGPAGARAAEAAAAAGLHVMAIEKRAAAGTPVQCAEFVPALLDQELPGLGPVTVQRIGRMLTYVNGDAPDETPEFRGRMIDRAAFDAALAEAAANAGADCRYGVAVEHIESDGTVQLAGGETLRPRLLIGTDGPRSIVGRAIGAANAALVETRQVTVPLNAPHDATDIFLGPEIVGGYAWLFPKGNVANLGLGVAPPARTRLKPLLEDLHARLVAQGRVGREVLCRTGGAIPVGGRVRCTGALGETAVLLAGDAAGLTNPVTGAGIPAAVISGALAGRAAAAFLKGDTSALARYDEDLAELFDASLARAVRRRQELLAAYAQGGPTADQLRRSWIAYPQYWAA